MLFRSGTHDVCPHGLVCGEWVESSRFVMFWCDSIRDGMEHYGDLYAALVPPRPWRKGSVPFGWNSYSAVGQGLQLSHWEQAGEFIRTALPNFCGEPGETFINLDGALGLDEQKIRQIIEELHKKGQKAGWYAIPCNWSPPPRSTPVCCGHRCAASGWRFSIRKNPAHPAQSLPACVHHTAQ